MKRFKKENLIVNITLLKLLLLENKNRKQIKCDRGGKCQSKVKNGLFSVFFNDTEIIFSANLIWAHNTLICSDNLDRKRTGEVPQKE